MSTCRFFHVCKFLSPLGEYLGSAVAGLYSKIMFSFVRSSPTVFQRGGIILHSCRQGGIAPHARQQLLSVF